MGYSIKRDLSGLNKLFIGYIFIFLNFRIVGFDLLPDFIGYIIILMGLYSLADVHIFFKRAIPFAWISGILSFLFIYQIPFTDSVPIWFFLYSLIAGLFVLIANLLLIYNIIYGVSVLFEIQGFFDISDRCKTIWQWYRDLRIVGYLLLLNAGLAFMLSIFLLIINAAVFIQFLAMLRRAYSFLRREYPPI